MAPRIGVLALLAATSSWAVLWLVLGNVGVQQLLSGAFEGRLAHPLPVALAGAAAFAAALVLARRLPPGTRAVAATAAAIIAFDLGAALVAVALVGELELRPEHVVPSLVVTSGFGWQVVAAAAGTWLARRTESAATG